MSVWILSIVSVVLLSSMIYLIMPEGKCTEIIKCIFALITLIVVLNPFINYDFNLLNVNSDNNFRLEYNENYLAHINDRKIEEYYNGCNIIFDNFSISGGKLLIDYNVDGDYNLNIKKVTINLSNAVIISDKEHIDIIEEITCAFANYLSINTKLIEVI